MQIDGLDEEDYYHWGLNFGIYTHFTSPIRRYADLLVHRLLTISLKEQEGTLDKLHGLDYSEYAQDVSVKAYNSKKASRDCDTLFHCLILKDFGRQVHEAVIFDIQDSQIGLMIHELDFHVFL